MGNSFTTTVAAAASATTLTAVNRILQLSQIAPVDSLDSGGASSAGRAESELGKTSTRIQARGWHQNTETDILYTPSGGAITLGSDVLRIDSYGRSAHLDIMQRGTTLFLRDETTSSGSTYTSTGFGSDDLHVTQVRELSFDVLSGLLADYIACESALQFFRLYRDKADKRSSRMTDMLQNIMSELQISRTHALNEDSDRRDLNLFDDMEMKAIRGHRHRYHDMLVQE